MPLFSGTAACFRSVASWKVLHVCKPTGGAAGVLRFHQTVQAPSPARPMRCQLPPDGVGGWTASPETVTRSMTARRSVPHPHQTCQPAATPPGPPQSARGAALCRRRPARQAQQ